VKGLQSPTAGKVTVGLALHWLCITDLSGLSTYRLNGLRKEDDTSPTLWGMAPFMINKMAAHYALSSS